MKRKIGEADKIVGDENNEDEDENKDMMEWEKEKQEDGGKQGGL